MTNRIVKVLTLTAALFFLLLLIFAIPSFFDPRFEVVNQSLEPVSVVAAWRKVERNLGTVEPGSSRRFSVDDEAAMTFKVRYASGRLAQSEPIYFSSGITVMATISEEGVSARYDFER